MQTPADIYIYRALEECATIDHFAAEVREILPSQPDGWRMTIVNDKHPNPEYPHGWYFEGWDARPIEYPPFDFPMAYANTSDSIANSQEIA